MRMNGQQWKVVICLGWYTTLAFVKGFHKELSTWQLNWRLREHGLTAAHYQLQDIKLTVLCRNMPISDVIYGEIIDWTWNLCFSLAEQLAPNQCAEKNESATCNKATLGGSKGKSTSQTGQGEPDIHVVLHEFQVLSWEAINGAN